VHLVDVIREVFDQSLQLNISNKRPETIYMNYLSAHRTYKYFHPVQFRAVSVGDIWYLKNTIKSNILFFILGDSPASEIQMTGNPPKGRTQHSEHG
jgi:hypothetical protein